MERNSGKNILEDDVILDMLEAEHTKEAGFKLLVEKYQEEIYWHIRRIVHLHEDADDVIQNTFIKVFRNIKNFRRDSKFYTWLYRIATNESITFLNSKKKHISEEVDESFDARLKADEYFDASEAQLLLKTAIESLPEKQKLVFNMRYYDNMTYADISEVLETSVGALKASYHHAINKVKSFVKENMTK